MVIENDFNEVIETLLKTGPIAVTKNGKGAALLIPISDDTDLETLILSNSRRFWKLFDQAAAGRRTSLEALPEPDNESAWKKLGARKRK